MCVWEKRLLGTHKNGCTRVFCLAHTGSALLKDMVILLGTGSKVKASEAPDTEDAVFSLSCRSAFFCVRHRPLCVVLTQWSSCFGIDTPRARAYVRSGECVSLSILTRPNLVGEGFIFIAFILDLWPRFSDIIPRPHGSPMLSKVLQRAMHYIAKNIHSSAFARISIQVTCHS